MKRNERFSRESSYVLAQVDTWVSEVLNENRPHCLVEGKLEKLSREEVYTTIAGYYWGQDCCLNALEMIYTGRCLTLYDGQEGCIYQSYRDAVIDKLEDWYYGSYYDVLADNYGLYNDKGEVEEEELEEYFLGEFYNEMIAEVDRYILKHVDRHYVEKCFERKVK